MTEKNNLDRLDELANQMCQSGSDLPEIIFTEEMKKMIDDKQAKIARCKKPDSKLRHYESLVLSLVAMLDGLSEIA